MLQPGDSHRERGLPVAGLLTLSLMAIGLLFAWLWWHGEGVPLKIQQVAAAAPARPGQSAALRTHLADPAQVLNRRDLVTFVRVLGAAQLADRQRLEAALAGRRFRVEVPLGCGPGMSFRSGASAHWWYDELDRAIRLQALPDIWASANNHHLTSAEIFWITRPRQKASDCPSGQAQPSLSAAVQQTSATPRIGLALTSRTSRSVGRSSEWNRYSSALSVTPTEVAELSPNLKLLLEGSVERDPQDGVTICNRASGRSAPDCAIASHIDRVAFVDAKSGALLAQWKASPAN
jgi:hypothetical protein